MKFNPVEYKYPSKRNLVYSHKGMVATSQPLAAQAGLKILKSGGNAVDAAIATAACLIVVEPTTNGLGSDSFALVWIKDKLRGLNASGYLPRSISIEKLKERGFKEIPKYGVIPVMVPGAPASWVELSEKFGKLPLEEVLQPAIDYARKGLTVSVNVKQAWDEAYNIYGNEEGEEFKYWFDTFTKKGKIPDYRGYDVHEITPNGQGFVALIALNILKGFDFSYKETSETYRRQIEAMKLAFADVKLIIIFY